MMSWLVNHYVELFGAVTGLIYLFLEIKQKVWLWPLGVVTSAFYIYIFFVSKFYADMGLQVYYLVISFYGWYYWLHGGKNKEANLLPVTHTPVKMVFGLVVVTVIFFFVIRFILFRFTDSPVPTGDAFTTALSITATWMLARKFIEHWWLWVVINAVSLALYVYKGLYPTSVLFVFYTTMSFVGYRQWKKELAINEVAESDKKNTSTC
ncbi:MAG TPA: nicotinamide riboside transporter PnuC [Tenuifilaceae bacterium]|nr:nicotinamide riboside transporter PnuC [Tenuifilaceae bacterium]